MNAIAGAVVTFLWVLWGFWLLAAHLENRRNEKATRARMAQQPRMAPWPDVKAEVPPKEWVPTASQAPQPPVIEGNELVKRTDAAVTSPQTWRNVWWESGQPRDLDGPYL